MARPASSSAHSSSSTRPEPAARAGVVAVEHEPGALAQDHRHHQGLGWGGGRRADSSRRSLAEPAGTVPFHDSRRSTACATTEGSPSGSRTRRASSSGSLPPRPTWPAPCASSPRSTSSRPRPTSGAARRSSPSVTSPRSAGANGACAIARGVEGGSGRRVRLVHPGHRLEQHLVRGDAARDHELLRVDADVAARRHRRDLEAEVAALPAAQLLHHEPGLLLQGLLELGLADGAALDQQLPQPAAVGREVLAVERLGEHLRRHQPPADEDVAEGLPDRARRGVDDPAQANDHEPVRLAAAEAHLAGPVVEREKVKQLGELDLLEPAGQAHGCSGSAGPSSIGAPGCEPADAADGFLGLRPGAPAQHPRERRQRGLGRRADRAERLHGGLAHAQVAVGDRLRELGHRRVPPRRPCSGAPSPPPRAARCPRRRASPRGRARRRGPRGPMPQSVLAAAIRSAGVPERSISASAGTAGSPSCSSFRRAWPLACGSALRSSASRRGMSGFSSFARQAETATASRTRPRTVVAARMPESSAAFGAGLRRVVDRGRPQADRACRRGRCASRIASSAWRSSSVGERPSDGVQQEAVAGLAEAGGDPHLARDEPQLAERPQQAPEEAHAVRPAHLQVQEASPLRRAVEVEPVEDQRRSVGRRRLLRERDVVDRLGVGRSGQGRHQELRAPGSRRLLASEAVQDRDAHAREPAREAIGPQGVERTPEPHRVEAAGVGDDLAARAARLRAGEEHERVVESAHGLGSLQAACSACALTPGTSNSRFSNELSAGPDAAAGRCQGTFLSDDTEPPTIVSQPPRPGVSGGAGAPAA